MGSTATWRVRDQARNWPLLDVLRCEECEQDSAGPPQSVAALDESTLIARQLDELTVPLLRIDGGEVSYLDPQQIESAAKTLTR
jgi:hypothetical protein